MSRPEWAWKWVLAITLTGVALAICTADAGTPGPAYVIKRALLAVFGI